jgi:CRISPR/Cas system-associated exonuclease Cas4 (RecB family)
MVIPDNFLFSQGNLQDYVDCRRRFQLRYLMHLSWPAIISEPVSEHEKLLRKGENFHHLIHQHLVGVPVDKLERTLAGLDLEEWWHHYLIFHQEIVKPDSVVLPEITFMDGIVRFRIMARYDLLLIDEKSIRIIDWKTSRYRPKRSYLENRIQTRVYPFLLSQAGNFLDKERSVNSKQMEMFFWFAEYPDQPEVFPYNQEKYEADLYYIGQLIEEISSLDEDDFTKTDDLEKCKYCVYRSFCDRGILPGDVARLAGDEIAENFEFSFDFEAIEEIEQ